ncbi:hypothetical protein JCM6882_000816 [Rhodosporidiobolus microsporus]
MSFSDSNNLKIARSVAVAGLCISAGVMGTIPFLSLPLLFTPGTHLTPDVRLHLWSRLFDRVSGAMKPWIMVNAALSAVVAWQVKDGSGLVGEGNWWGKNRRIILALSALFNFLIAPYSMGFLYPINARLKRVEAGLSKHDSSDARAAAAHEADVVLERKWPRVYTGKLVLGLVALGLAVGELAFA